MPVFAGVIPAVEGGRHMTRRILQSALLSLSLSLTGCAVYEVDHRGYSAPRYPSYGYQQPV